MCLLVIFTSDPLASGSLGGLGGFRSLQKAYNAMAVSVFRKTLVDDDIL